MSLHFDRYFSRDADSSTTRKVDVQIKNPSGEVLFEQKDVLVPDIPGCWSDQAVTIVANKYFYGDVDGEGTRESSIDMLIDRVVDTISDAGEDQGLLDIDSAQVFSDELRWLLRNQYGAFNSPVWFNVGLGHNYGITEEDESSWIYGWKDDQFGPGVDRVDPYGRPQASACFIISAEDTIEGIWSMMSESARLFKYGSGVGADWSALRSTQDTLSGGGTPSGPVSFMRVQDATGGTIKSGGKTRRAAIMQTLKSWHPDIQEFIGVKSAEERKAHALIDAGYDGSFNGEAYATVAFQNVNQSVRIDDAFMDAYNLAQPFDEELGYSDWYTLRSPSTGKELDQVLASEMMRKIAEGTWFCGDPGVQYEDTIQRWHTCSNDGPINSSNPCSEYMFLDDSACNLASINLKKFWNAQTQDYDAAGLEAAARVFITAQEILVDRAGYPSAKIAKNSHLYRPLGLGFANLGATLMAMGLPYNSQEGRAFAAGAMAVIHAAGYDQSAFMAREVGPFDRYEANKESVLNVLRMHRDSPVTKSESLYFERPVVRNLWKHANDVLETMVGNAEMYGVRNAQATVLAPTGTIAFMMDCDTTGIEPELALVKWKKLAGKGDGIMKIVNQTVEEGLQALAYRPITIKEIIAYIDENGYAEGAPGLHEEHYPVFDTSFRPDGCSRIIPWKAHVDMMAACQPFVSGAISKTINMDTDATVDEIEEAYVYGWEVGLKAIAIYRDGSKRTQPLNTAEDVEKTVDNADMVTMDIYDAADELYHFELPVSARTSLNKLIASFEQEIHRLENDRDGLSDELAQAGFRVRDAELTPVRRRLPDNRPSIIHKFRVGTHKGYLHIGLYPDTKMPGEIFINVAKEGSTISGLMDSFATAVSMGLQYGVPLPALVDKFSFVTFEPSGFTNNPIIRTSTSIIDYIFRWLGQSFVTKEQADEISFFNEPAPITDEPHIAPLPDEVLEMIQGSSWDSLNGSANAESVEVATPPAAVGGGSPPCDRCGNITMRSGTCYTCTVCGSTSGCG